MAGAVRGQGNAKSGNRYLAWAYVEAAHFAARHSPELRAWYRRKAAKTQRVVAIKAASSRNSTRKARTSGSDGTRRSALALRSRLAKQGVRMVDTRIKERIRPARLGGGGRKCLLTAIL